MKMDEILRPDIKRWVFNEMETQRGGVVYFWENNIKKEKGASESDS